MKLIIKNKGKTVKAIKAEYSPVEWIVARQAMHRFVEDKEVDIVDKLIMKDMLVHLPEEWREK